MSRIGKKPIPIPEKVTVSATDNLIMVKGPKGESARTIHPDIGVEIKKDELLVTPKREGKKTPALYQRRIPANVDSEWRSIDGAG